MYILSAENKYVVLYWNEENKEWKYSPADATKIKHMQFIPEDIKKEDPWGHKLGNMKYVSLDYAIVNLALDGLYTDGSHHKQWFLYEIIKLLNPGALPEADNIEEPIVP